MKILLIFPPNVDILEPFCSAKKKPQKLLWGFPLGLGYLAAVLRRAGFEVSIIDACIDTIPLDEILEKVKGYQPDLVGIGTMTQILRTSIECAKRIKLLDKDIKIILGGPHATYDYGKLLNFDFIDYIVVGEGEDTFLELCEKLKENKAVEEIQGIAFRDKYGVIKKNTYRPLIKDLDSLPFPDRELVDFRRYIKTYGVLEKSVDVMSSRGCTNVCAFCSSSHLFGRWRPRSPENIISEIKYLTEKFPEIQSINFMDDDFTVSKERTIKLCSLLVNSGFKKYKWACLARVDQLDEEIVFAMKNAGCIRVHLGIESGSPVILKNINKRITLEEAHMAVRLLTSAGIEAVSFFIIGNPGETSETIELSKKFARELKSTNTIFFVSQVFPGTKLERLQPVDNWVEYLYKPEVDNPSLFAHPCVPSFIPEGFNRETLKKICNAITMRFILLHFIGRYRLFIRKFMAEPKATVEYIFKVFFNR